MNGAGSSGEVALTAKTGSAVIGLEGEGSRSSPGGHHELPIFRDGFFSLAYLEHEGEWIESGLSRMYLRPRLLDIALRRKIEQDSIHFRGGAVVQAFYERQHLNPGLSQRSTPVVGRIEERKGGAEAAAKRKTKRRIFELRGQVREV